MKVVSFLASGRGTNFKTVAEAILNKKINAKPGVLITSKKNCGAIEVAKNLNFPVVPLSWKKSGSREVFEEKVLEILKDKKTDLLVCVGYMKILSPGFIKEFPNRIINIHPALLPSFPGLDAQEQALNYGVKVSGCTAHFINEGVDTGPIIFQQAVPVLDDDDSESLSARILKEEHKIIQKAVQHYCDGLLMVKGREVLVI